MAGGNRQAIHLITYVTIYQEGFILRTKKALSFESALVRETGLEPACTIVHMNLNHARLPIPPFPQIGGQGWIRTTEVGDGRFTVCSLWPLGNLPKNINCEDSFFCKEDGAGEGT